MSWFEKLSPTHTHPLKTIHEFLKPYEWGGVGHTWVGCSGVGHTGVGWVMIITLVPREKSRKVACVLNGTEMLSTKATTNKNMSYII